MARNRVPSRCRLGQHGPEVYPDSLLFVQVERCKRCNAIVDPVMAELWEFEEKTTRELQDIKPIRERNRRIKRLVMGQVLAKNIPLAYWE